MRCDLRWLKRRTYALLDSRRWPSCSVLFLKRGHCALDRHGWTRKMIVPFISSNRIGEVFNRGEAA